jgi:hypothetical protein
VFQEGEGVNSINCRTVQGGDMKVRLLLALVCALGTVMVSATPALAVEPVVVVNTERPEIGPAASTTFLAWVVFSPRFNPSVRAQATGSDTSFRVNPRGTGAFTGGIDGSTLLYEQFVPGEGGSDLVMVDLSTRTELDLPDGVNTNASEFSPNLSGSHFLFGRSIRHGASIVLFDTTTSASEVVYSKMATDRRRFPFLPTQINGNYAVWHQATVSKRTGELIRTDIFLYDIAAATTTRIPNADTERPVQYGPSVDSDGVMYFGRSSDACGKNAQLISREPDGTETVLYEFPTNRDFGFSHAVDNVNNTTDVYFDRGSCRGEDFGNIWKLSGV